MDNEKVILHTNGTPTNNDVTTNTTNSDKNSSRKNYHNEERGASKGQNKRQPSSGVGINLLKFPPGFFGEDPFKIMEGRASRKRSNEKSKNSTKIDQENERPL
jgi:hypothetical protein